MTSTRRCLWQLRGFSDATPRGFILAQGELLLLFPNSYARTFDIAGLRVTRELIAVMTFKLPTRLHDDPQKHRAYLLSLPNEDRFQFQSLRTVTGTTIVLRFAKAHHSLLECSAQSLNWLISGLIRQKELSFQSKSACCYLLSSNYSPHNSTL